MASLQSSPSVHPTLFFNSSSSQIKVPGTLLIPVSKRSSPPLIRAEQSSSAPISSQQGHTKRALVLTGFGALATNLFSTSCASAEEVPKNYQAFVDFIDGYSYYYPSDWRDFDFRGHDSAFKDRSLPLQNVRVSFKPTDKTDIHDLGPMEEAIFNLVRNVFSAPTQRITIFDMQERTADGKTYWTFEYELATRSFARTAFATIAIGNGRYYTLIVGANERRWSRLRNQLKVVADSFKLLDI